MEISKTNESNYVYIYIFIEAILNSSKLFCTSESFYCQREALLHNKTLHAESFCTEKLSDADAFAQNNFTHKQLFHMGTFHTEKLL